MNDNTSDAKTQTMQDRLSGLSVKKLGRKEWTLLYTSIVTIAGMVIMILALSRLPDDLIDLLVFMGISVLAELTSVHVFKSSHSTVSVSSVVTMASILLFGPLTAALTSGVSGAMTALTTLRSQQQKKGRASWFRRSAFNVGMFVISTAIGGWVFVLTGGTFDTVAHLTNILPLILAVTTDTFVNAIILFGVLVLQTGQHPRHILEQDFEWYIPIAIIGGVLGGGVLALAYEMFQFLGVAVFMIPIISTSYSLRLYVKNSQVYVEKLEDANLALDEANVELLETLGAVIDAYDAYTYGHSRQVAVYAEAIAQKMGLGKEEQKLVIKSALVHDIGKISVMDSVISKPGALTDEEYNILKRHPLIGAEILGRMKGLHALVPAVRGHHERWDGKGYPDGLSKEEIPLIARIVALADTLDAMCSDRPYRRTRSFKEVKDEIVSCAGTQFDPSVVKAFVILTEERGNDFFKNSAASVSRTLPIASIVNGGNSIGHFLKKSMVSSEKN